MSRGGDGTATLPPPKQALSFSANAPTFVMSFTLQQGMILLSKIAHGGGALQHDPERFLVKYNCAFLEMWKSVVGGVFIFVISYGMICKKRQHDPKLL
mmetsp:Transcript_14334/g.38383  ORF Transcript_14334/g.38383 Transcript_14334/m.38383 type:complete len:98 (-) Transcript_14334:63-356(-)